MTAGGFRPLTGIKVSEPSLQYLNNNGFINVSVPSRGLRYLNEIKEARLCIMEACFRPLTGIKVSELPVSLKVRYEKPGFPSPHGD